MSTLSKVFVVLVLLASVVFAMTSLARLSTTENYKEKFQKEETAKDQALLDKKTAEENLAVEGRAHNETRSTLQSQITDKVQEIESLKAAKKLAEDQLNSIKDSLEKNTADLASVKKELEEFRKANERLRTELDDAVKRAGDDRTARLDAEQLLKESQQKVKNCLEDIANKEAQIIELLKRVETLDNIVKAYQTMTGVPAPDLTKGPEVDITGVVTDVRREGTDVYIGLSVGSTSDVKVGTRFIIFGEGTYKGDMLITKVYPDSSFGRLTAAGTRDVAKGDTAKTSLKKPGS